MSSTPDPSLPNAPRPNIWGVACRPTFVFVAAFALSITPHEAVHAITGYLLGFSSTLFQMWVNPDTASATSGQLATIAAAGPIFSLTVGVICWVLYRWRFERRSSGLVFLMLAGVGIYSFLGPLADSAFGGDFHIAFAFLRISKAGFYLGSAAGLILLPSFMFLMGKELVRWAPREFYRVKAVACATIAPWLIGTLITLLVYWPLPAFLVGSTIAGSVFWLFAVIGAAFGFSNSRHVEQATSFTPSDLLIAFVALAMVRLLVNGVHLAH
ncbi:MAG: hypothetical protein ABSC48_19760 [Terracidiphilus sp.]